MSIVLEICSSNNLIPSILTPREVKYRGDMYCWLLVGFFLVLSIMNFYSSLKNDKPLKEIETTCWVNVLILIKYIKLGCINLPVCAPYEREYACVLYVLILINK